MNNFELSSNLHLVFFAVLFFIDFVLFNWGLIVLLVAKGETNKMQKGRKILTLAFVLFIVILLVVLVFYIATYFLKGGEAFIPTPEEAGEFPYPSHIGSIFPPGPDFIKLGIFYFSGPKLLKDNKVVEENSIYAVLCPNNKEYDIIYVDSIMGNTNLADNSQYDCWIEKCNQGINNLYLALLVTPQDIYDANRKERVKTSLEDKFKPVCFKSQEFEEEF